jgi:hypothetical protein
MADLVEQVASPAGLVTLLIAIAVFSFTPQLLLHLLVMIYPKAHPRRRELIAELAVVELWKRPFWAAEMLVAVPFEGLPIRWQQRKDLARAKEVESRSAQRAARDRAVADPADRELERVLNRASRPVYQARSHVDVPDATSRSSDTAFGVPHVTVEPGLPRRPPQRLSDEGAFAGELPVPVVGMRGRSTRAGVSE